MDPILLPNPQRMLSGGWGCGGSVCSDERKPHDTKTRFRVLVIVIGLPIDKLSMLLDPDTFLG